MRVAVFGGTGPTGRLLIAELLGRGHQVVALARSVRRLHAGGGLTLIEAPLTDESAIEAAVRGADAVASALGPHGPSPGLPVAAGMMRIVEVMDRTGVQRIVAVSTASAHDERDRPDFKQRLLVDAVRTLVPSAYGEIVKTAEVLRASDLAWTLVRVPLLRTSRRGPAPLTVGYPGVDDIGFFVSRQGVASFIADELASPKWQREAPMICDAPRHRRARNPL